MRWFNIHWWRYLLAPTNKYYRDQSWARAILCRLRGHPEGQVYYNPLGTEPNTHCRICGDDIG